MTDTRGRFIRGPFIVPTTVVDDPLLRDSFVAERERVVRQELVAAHLPVGELECSDWVRLVDGGALGPVAQLSSGDPRPTIGYALMLTWLAQS
jgi:hypothetical protein